ncbi:MAG: hypothetical protein J5869_04910 [Bacteroidaceae bacterium]|nr:hypothetical protein [Bacteroidaceae bacterium]
MTRFLPYRLSMLLLLPMLLVALTAHSQEITRPVILLDDTLRATRIDSLYKSLNDTARWQQELEYVRNLNISLPSDSAMIIDYASPAGSGRLTWKEKDSIQTAMLYRTAPEWEPDPRKAVWMSLLFPGGGQIYNRKYWKLPIVYGGFVGCIYALTWNQSTYMDYQNAYVDIMDNDPTTKSYEDFLPPHYEIDSYTTDWLKEVFKKRKDKYRRYRDLSIFAFAGMYIISAIDAYVDAELSHFDISSDLSLRVEPSIIIDHRGAASSGFSLAFCF